MYGAEEERMNRQSRKNTKRGLYKKCASGGGGEKGFIFIAVGYKLPGS